MKHSVETISDKTKLVKVEIPVERIDSEFQKLYTEINQNAFIPGFRKGRVPKSILKLRMGDDIATQIGYELIQETLPEAMKSIEDQVLGYPELNKWVVEEGKPFVYEATVTILPPIELKEYKGIEVPRGKLDISDIEIAQGLERIQAAQTTYEVVEGRMAESQDRIYGRFSMTIDDQAVPGWTNRQVEIDIGANTFFPDSSMEEGMIGASVEADHKYVVNFPEDYAYYRDFAGKTVSVVIKVDDIKAKQVPEISDDLAKDMGLENVDELKKMIKEDLEKRKAKEIDEAFESAILTRIQSCNDIPAPDSMVESEAEFMVESFFSRQMKMDADQKKKLSETMKPAAEKRVRERLILSRIAELEGIQPTQEDIDKAFTEIAEQEKSDPATIRQDWEKDNLMENLKRQIARNKAMVWLKENVVPVDPPPPNTSDDIPDETDSQE